MSCQTTDVIDVKYLLLFLNESKSRNAFPSARNSNDGFYKKWTIA